MDFNSLTFLGFFAAAAVLNYLLPRVARPYFLLVASYAFYLYKPENRQLAALLVGATVITWACGLALGRLQNRWARLSFVALALVCCGGILFWYKYFGFFDRMFVDLTNLLGGHQTLAIFDLVAPLGLSYFTFQSLGYVIDVYRGQAPCKNPFKYALFVSFFPCIFTGPIERYGHLMPQFDHPRRFDYDRCAGGAFRMLWGYFKKMVLADSLALYVSSAFSADGQPGPVLLVAALLVSFQIYLDFSGCCDIAIGGAAVLGYDLLENFDNPFLATNLGDFWRRWHISLTSWFRDYVYIPLGGSRCAPWRHYCNLLAIFLLSGLWHGADWGYLWWGVCCGAFCIAELLLSRLFAPQAAHAGQRAPGFAARWLGRLRVFLLFSASLCFFASAMYGTALPTLFEGLSAGWNAAGWAAVPALFDAAGFSNSLRVVLLCGLPIVQTVESQGPVNRWVRRQVWPLRWTLYYGLGAAMLFFGSFGQSAFIYQQY